MARQYEFISADSHLEIAPERWTHRIPSRLRDHAPHRVRHSAGGDAIVIENRPLYIVGLGLAAKQYQDHAPCGVTYEGSVGAGDPEQRLHEQDQDGIDVEVLFPGGVGPRFWRGIKNDAAYNAVVRAYNDFLAEDYCAVASDRLIGIGVIPVTGVDDAVAELEHCIKLGLKGVMLSRFPSGHGYPTPKDDSFWSAALDLDMPITVHQALDHSETKLKFERDPGELDHGGKDFIQLIVRAPNGQAPVQFILGGVFDRFPKLRIFFAETQIGWIPWFLENVDDRYERNQYWADNLLGLRPLPRRPSEYILEHCFWGFNCDFTGVSLRHKVGVERIMWGSDFPHQVGNWPGSHDLIREMFRGVPEEETRKIVSRNAVEFFHLGN